MTYVSAIIAPDIIINVIIVADGGLHVLCLLLLWLCLW